MFHEDTCAVHMSYIFDGMQYPGKAETTFNMRLINRRIDVKSPYSETILGCYYFREKNHNFQTHAEFIVIVKRINTKNLKK